MPTNKLAERRIVEVPDAAGYYFVALVDFLRQLIKELVFNINRVFLPELGFLELLARTLCACVNLS